MGRYNLAVIDGEVSVLPETARRLFELSANAFSAFVHAWMSELPIEAEAARFGRKVLAAGSGAAQGAPEPAILERRAAEKAATDRLDPDVEAVLSADFKVWREIHRLLGFLRFEKDHRGWYAARCAPDHFVLPAMVSHFRRRFGETPWAIIDEKRRISLVRPPGKEPELKGNIPPEFCSPGAGGPWEDLWQTYYQSTNNPDRKNPGLRKQFMPERYWKYLTEIKPG